MNSRPLSLDHLVGAGGSDGGISRPRAFAVVRLTTRSNLVGCSTGRSAGFVPRKILSTDRQRAGIAWPSLIHRTSGLPLRQIPEQCASSAVVQTQRQSVDTNSVGAHKWVGDDIKRLHMTLHRLERESDVLGPPDVERETSRPSVRPPPESRPNPERDRNWRHWSGQPICADRGQARARARVAYRQDRPLARYAGNVAARSRQESRRGRCRSDPPAVANTIGMAEVACFAARTVRVLCVRITSTFRRTNSAAISV